jgi:hypothetical protein
MHILIYPEMGRTSAIKNLISNGTKAAIPSKVAPMPKQGAEKLHAKTVTQMSYFVHILQANGVHQLSFLILPATPLSKM